MTVVRKVFTQTIWQVVARAVGALSTLIILGIVTRSYGQEGTGVFTLALTYIAIFFIFADLGINAYLLPKVSDKGEINNIYNLRLYWSILLVVLANALVLILPIGNIFFKYAVLIGSVSIISSGILATTNLIFQSKLKYQYSMIAGVVGALAQIPVILYLAYLKVPIALFALGPLFGWLVNTLISLFLVGKFHKFELVELHLAYPLKILKTAWPVSLTLLLNVIYFRVDAFILSSSHSFREVGIYNLAYTIFQDALVIPSFIMNSFYPIMLENLKAGTDKFFKQIKLSSLILLILALLGVFLTWVFAPLLVKIIAGEGFYPSVEPLRILSFSFPAYFLTALLMFVYFSLGKFYHLAAIYVIGFLANFLLNLIFIPKYSYLASSWITGVSEYLILGLQILILYQILRKRN